MEATFLAVLLAFCRCALCKESHVFDGDVIIFAFGVDKLFVLTDTQLHQVKLDLNPETQKEISNATASNKVEVLVPFVYNGTVITCGSYDCGYCEVLDISNISKTIHKEDVGIGAYPSIAVIIDHQDDKYLLVGKNREKSECDSGLITLRDTKDGHSGEIFAKKDIYGSPSSSIQNIGGTEIDFVDGFQHAASSHVCLLLNEKRGSRSTVKLLSLDSKYTKDGIYTKAGTFSTLQGAILQCCESDEGRQWRLLSSAVIPGESPVFWAGVFQVETNPGETVVAIFDISRSRTAPVSGFCINRGDACPLSQEEKSVVLRPVAVVFRNSSITSVAALKSNSWTVLFFGTKTGQLIKVALDESLKPGCPAVLYSSEEDRTFLPKMLFAPVNPTDIYIAQGNQMIKVPVARCGVYQTLGDCWSALDPFCGWCVSQSRCRFQHDCSGSDWVSVPGTSQQRDIMSVHMVNAGQDITVTAAPNLNGGVRFSCALEKCASPGPSNCSCIFSSESFPAAGLSLRVTITVQTETLTKDVLLKNCSSIRGTPTSDLCMECLSAGCVWSLSGDECTWTASSDPTGNSTTTEDVCKHYSSELNYTRPEILSITPDEVSVHGQSRAVIKGRSLGSVTKVRFQGSMDCSPKESPVLSHSGNSSSHESLTFHIPSGTIRGATRVCVLTADGQCHGNAKLTYDSPPTCSRLTPNITWASGGREVSLEGSKLEFVEAVKHSGSSEQLRPHGRYGMLVYYTPAGVLDSAGSSQVSVELLVGNTSVTCREELTYHPDPQFTSFTTTRMGNNIRVVIQKSADALQLKGSEVDVQVRRGAESYRCVMDRIERSADLDSVICEVRGMTDVSVAVDTLTVRVGGFSVVFQTSDSQLYRNVLIPLAAVLFTLVVIYCCHRRKRRSAAERVEAVEPADKETTVL